MKIKFGDSKPPCIVTVVFRDMEKNKIFYFYIYTCTYTYISVYVNIWRKITKEN